MWTFHSGLFVQGFMSHRWIHAVAKTTAISSNSGRSSRRKSHQPFFIHAEKIVKQNRLWSEWEKKTDNRSFFAAPDRKWSVRKSVADADTDANQIFWKRNVSISQYDSFCLWCDVPLSIQINHKKWFCSDPVEVVLRKRVQFKIAFEL